jgi:histidinol dehydrogenase
VGIDMVAGPSEVLVVADQSATPRYVAADLLSQAEHDPLAAAILVTDSQEMLEQVKKELEIQTALLPKREIVEHSLSHYGALIRVKDLPAAIEIANAIAPEHLELAVADPFAWLGAVKNAGAVFLGHYAPEPLGDYFAGPNHVLPTNGTARFFSPLSVDDFIKKSSLISYQKESLQAVYQDIGAFPARRGLRPMNVPSASVLKTSKNLYK